MSEPLRAWLTRLGWILPLLGGLAALWTGGQQWFVAGDTGGQATTGLATALATVALVAVLLILVLGRSGRRFIGVVEAIIGIAMIVIAGGARPIVSEDPLGRAAQTSTAATGWLAGYQVAAAAIVVGGVLLIAFRPRRRVETPTDDPDAWVVLDRGTDPTSD